MNQQDVHHVERLKKNNVTEDNLSLVKDYHYCNDGLLY